MLRIYGLEGIDLINIIYHLKRILAENELFIVIFIFGFFSMLADFLSDIEESNYAAIIRFVGLAAFVIVFGGYWILNKHHEPIMVPIMFTEDNDKKASRNMFAAFINSNKKLNNHSKLLEKISRIKSEDLIIRLDANPRNSSDSNDWVSAWNELVREWEDDIDRELTDHPLSNEGYCYHIFPHIVLPLSFALGATINLRKSLILYHYQNSNAFNKVIDLTNPRSVSSQSEDEFTEKVLSFKTNPEDFNNLKRGKKLILHIVISARHPVNFQLHDEYQTASNAAIVYASDLNPNEDWLPYIQKIITISKPVINLYEKVDICLICPSAIAFALGMAFSRNGSVEVCHYCCDGKYRPVFPLAEIEQRLHFS